MITTVVVGTDGSHTATEAVRHAADLAGTAGARLYVVSAYEPVPKNEVADRRRGVPEDVQWLVGPKEDVELRLAERIEPLRGDGLQIEVMARAGDPAEVLLDTAEELGADLLVVGNKGMTGAARFLLGSVPNKISHHAHCSVLIVRTT